MASLYTINQQILDCIDLETGEILDEEQFSKLQIDKNLKLENIALYYKNILADSIAYKAEKDVFAEKEKRAKNKAESLKRYLDTSLNGRKFNTSKVDIGYRKSTFLDYSDDVDIPKQFLKPQDPKIDIAGITKAIKDGEEIEGFILKENNNIQIK